MGDRTYVELTFDKVFEAKVRKIAKSTYDEPSEECASSDELFVCFSFEEVNYGELPEEFYQAMLANGIAYDMRWHAGGSYSAGTKTVRFNEQGELQELSNCDEDMGLPLNILLEAIDDHEHLKKLIRDHEKETVPWPWENQVACGKLYRVHRLIDPGTPST